MIYVIDVCDTVRLFFDYFVAIESASPNDTSRFSSRQARTPYHGSAYDRACRDQASTKFEKFLVIST